MNNWDRSHLRSRTHTAGVLREEVNYTPENDSREILTQGLIVEQSPVV